MYKSNTGGVKSKFKTNGPALCFTSACCSLNGLESPCPQNIFKLEFPPVIALAMDGGLFYGCPHAFSSRFSPTPTHRQGHTSRNCASEVLKTKEIVITSLAVSSLLPNEIIF